MDGPSPKEQIARAFFGTELEKIEAGTARTESALATHGIAPDFDALRQLCRGFFETPAKSRYSGPITAGDAFFSGCFIAALRPERMIEFGVSSGVSTAFLLAAADDQDVMGDGLFLTAVDITDDLGGGNRTGQVVPEKVPDLEKHLDLCIGDTSFDLLQSGALAQAMGPGAVLAHVDADHCHPWPLIDILALYLTMPAGSWILLQDVAMVERWLFGTILNGKPVPRPLRGPSIAFSHWPGTKILGEDMCYNMGAIRLDIDAAAILQFIADCRAYGTELGSSDLSDADPGEAARHLEILEAKIRFKANARTVA